MPMQGRDLLLWPGFAAPRDRPCHSPPLPSGMGLEKKNQQPGLQNGIAKAKPREAAATSAANKQRFCQAELEDAAGYRKIS